MKNILQFFYTEIEIRYFLWMIIEGLMQLFVVSSFMSDFVDWRRGVGFIWISRFLFPICFFFWRWRLWNHWELRNTNCFSSVAKLCLNKTQFFRWWILCFEYRFYIISIYYWSIFTSELWNSQENYEKSWGWHSFHLIEINTTLKYT